MPNYEPRAFREALVNALVHRDYTRLGAVHVRWETDAIVVSNPGGFVDGVTLDNLLVVEPRPRNPLLADAVKRIWLAERTGRGIDLIFQGLLRYGRPAPDSKRWGSRKIMSDRLGSTRSSRNRWCSSSPRAMEESRGNKWQNYAGSAKIKRGVYSRNS